MPIQKTVIAGTGGHAQMLWATWKSFASDAVEVIGWLAHADYQGATSLQGLPIFLETPENLDRLKQEGVEAFYFGIGMIKAWPGRWEVFQRLCALGFTPLTLMHPTSVLSTSPEAIFKQGSCKSRYRNQAEASSKGEHKNRIFLLRQ